jgi:hypothetical protein
MSIETTSEILRDKAKEYLAKAYENLLMVLEEEATENNFNSKYIDTLHEVSLEVLKLKRKL